MPDFVSRAEDVQLINFPKHHSISSCIKSLLAYQKTIELNVGRQDPLYTFLYDLPCMNDKELYALSLEREPKGVLLKDLD